MGARTHVHLRFRAPTKVIACKVKIIGWYDNRWGYSNRLVDLVALVGESLLTSSGIGCLPRRCLKMGLVRWKGIRAYRSSPRARLGPCGVRRRIRAELAAQNYQSLRILRSVFMRRNRTEVASKGGGDVSSCNVKP